LDWIGLDGRADGRTDGNAAFGFLSFSTICYIVVGSVWSGLV